SLSFNLMRDIVAVSEIKSVQKNRETLFGYYKLQVKQGATVVIPYLIEQHENDANRLFFQYLNENFKIEVESKLFPIIYRNQSLIERQIMSFSCWTFLPDTEDIKIADIPLGKVSAISASNSSSNISDLVIANRRGLSMSSGL